MWRLVCGGFLFLLAGCFGSSSPSPPWGGERHSEGPLVDPASESLVTALEWGQANAEQVETLINAYYRQTHLSGPVIQSVTLHTKWTHLARHAAAQALARKSIDRKIVESLAASPHLTVELTLQGYHQGIITGTDVFLVQRGTQIYPVQVQTESPRLTTDREEQKIYEGTLRIDFSYEGLDLRREAEIVIRRDEGSDLSFTFDLGQYR